MTVSINPAEGGIAREGMDKYKYKIRRYEMNIKREGPLFVYKIEDGRYCRVYAWNFDYTVCYKTKLYDGNLIYTESISQSRLQSKVSMDLFRRAMKEAL